jgi:hypothetical protein
MFFLLALFATAVSAIVSFLCDHKTSASSMRVFSIPPVSACPLLLLPACCFAACCLLALFAFSAALFACSMSLLLVSAYLLVLVPAGVPVDVVLLASFDMTLLSQLPSLLALCVPGPSCRL